MNGAIMREKACQLSFYKTVFFALSFFLACSSYANDAITCLKYYDNRQFEKACSCFLQPHVRENPEVQYCLGVLYLKGKGVKQDYSRARQWFEKSALQGYSRGQFGMGTLYEYGRGVPRNHEQAIKWYIKAANQKYSRTQTKLGYLHEKGLGVPQDYEKARQWYARAAAQGNTSAMTNLGVLFANGQGGEQDKLLAFMLYKKAAEMGDYAAQYNLAELYRVGGRVTSKNPEKALYWYCQSADQDTPQAMKALSRIYNRGLLGQKVNKPLAREWATKADAAKERQRMEKRTETESLAVQKE